MYRRPVLGDTVAELSSAREGHYFDRKSARIKPDDLARTLVAFANASGGRLVVGMEDDGSLTGFGVSGAQEPEDFEQCAIMRCVPAPDVSCRRVHFGDEGDFLLVIDVLPSADRVISRKRDGKVFLRQGDKSVELDRDQVRALEYDKSQRVFEDELVADSSLDDVDHEVLDRYKSILGTASSDEQVLRSRRFLRDGKLTVAGSLLFALDPSAMLPQARVRVIRFDGVKMGTGRSLNITKERTFGGPLAKVIEGASALVSGMLRDFQFLGPDGRFETVPEYPEFAWFEGLVNAVTHRDYAFRGDYVRVLVYDDRMEIVSPGRLPNIVTLDNMMTTRYSRNPRIARTLAEFGWVRELNEGVPRIYSEMREMLLKAPVYSEPDGARVQLTLENSIAVRVQRSAEAPGAGFPHRALDGLSEYELAAVRRAFSSGSVSTGELAGLVGKSPRVCSRVLKGLADRGLLVWHGTSPNDPMQRYTLPFSPRSSAE